MHYTAYIDDLDVPRWMILAGGGVFLFGMVHFLFGGTEDGGSNPGGSIGTSVSTDLSTSTISSGSVPSEPNP
jgi:hypothetical protein